MINLSTYKLEGNKLSRQSKSSKARIGAVKTRIKTWPSDDRIEDHGWNQWSLTLPANLFLASTGWILSDQRCWGRVTVHGDAFVDPAVVYSIGGYTWNLYHWVTNIMHGPSHNITKRYRDDMRLIIVPCPRAGLTSTVRKTQLCRLSCHATQCSTSPRLAPKGRCTPFAMSSTRHRSVFPHREHMFEREGSLDRLVMPNFMVFSKIMLYITVYSSKKHWE